MKLIYGGRNLKYTTGYTWRRWLQKRNLRDFLDLIIFHFLIWVLDPTCIQLVKIYQAAYLKYVPFSVCVIYFYKMWFFIKKGKRREKRPEALFFLPTLRHVCVRLDAQNHGSHLNQHTKGSRAGSRRTRLNHCINLPSGSLILEIISFLFGLG